jgi:glyoxylase I family protein
MNAYAMHHVTVNIVDLTAAKAFYGDVLELIEVPRPRSFDFPGAWYQLGATQLHLVGKQEADAFSTAHFALQVMDIDRLRERLAQTSHEIQEIPPVPGISRFMMRDPDGNLIELVGPERPWMS